MIRHHPDDSLLLAHAGSSLDTGAALLVESHLEGCLRCRQIVQGFERVGGQLLEVESEQALAQGALEAVLARLKPRQDVCRISNRLERRVIRNDF